MSKKRAKPKSPARTAASPFRREFPDPPEQNIGALLKPTSATCNLRCDYCFYNQVPPGADGSLTTRVSFDTLETFTRQYLDYNRSCPLFAWQGGEPLQLGVDFFKRALELQAKYADPRCPPTNSLQTNGTLLDEEYAKFFAQNNFLVGVSIDGPPEIHNRHRPDAQGRPTHGRVLAGLRLLQNAAADFNILCVLHSENAALGRGLMDYFLGLGFRHFQFIPCAERAGPDGLAQFSIRAKQYADFLVETFDRWATWDGEPVSVRLFESIVRAMMGGEPESCILRENCQNMITVEANGDIYPCEFFVRPERRYGNVNETPLRDILAGPVRAQFRSDIKTRPARCRRCKWDWICKGGCPKYREIKRGRFDDVNYFCKAFMPLFERAEQAVLDYRRRNPQTPTPPGPV